MTDKDSSGVSWSQYLMATLMVPKFGALLCLPILPVLLWLQFGASSQDPAGEYAILFMVWGAMHLGSALCCLIAPVDFGLKLYFPPLSKAPSNEALVVVRMLIAMDLLCAGIRFAYGLVPNSGYLFLLAGFSALVQGLCFLIEKRKGTVDVNALSLGLGGTAILLLALVWEWSKRVLMF